MKRTTLPQPRLAPREETVRLDPDQARQWRPNKRQMAIAGRRSRERQKLAQANAAPLPGPLREAFASDPPQILGLRLQPITATHIAALTRINNPFVTGIALGFAHAAAKTRKEKNAIAAKVAAMPVTLEDTVEVLYLFTLAPAEVRHKLTHGPKRIREEAVALLDGLPPVPLDWLGAALAQHYTRSFETRVKYELAREKDEINFPTPAQATASAG